MITKDAYQRLTSTFACFGGVNDKLKEIIRDELEPSDEVTAAKSATIQGVDGVVCLTEKSVHAFWTQKMFFFLKIPAIQTFHLEHIRRLELSGNQLFMRSEVDPKNPDEDYEKNTFVFSSAAEAEEFYKAIGEVTPLTAS